MPRPPPVARRMGWATPLGTLEDDTRTPSLVHSAQSQRLPITSSFSSTIADRRVFPIALSGIHGHFEYNPPDDSDPMGRPARGLSSLPTQQMIPISEGMGRIGPEYHFDRRTAPADDGVMHDGSISLNNFNPPPLEALPSDTSIGQIQGIRPSDSAGLDPHSTTIHVTPGPLLAGTGVGGNRLTPTSERYITPPTQLGRHRPKVEGPDTLSSGARTHPDLRPDGQDTPTYSLNSTPSTTGKTRTVPLDADANASPLSVASEIEPAQGAGESASDDAQEEHESDAENRAQPRPFEAVETRDTMHTIATESGWETIDSNEDDENAPPAIGGQRTYISDIDIMRRALEAFDLSDKPRLVPPRPNGTSSNPPSLAPPATAGNTGLNSVATPQPHAVKKWQETAEAKRGKARFLAQLRLEDWERSESGKLPNYLRREQGEKLDDDTNRRATWLHPPHPVRQRSVSSDSALPASRSEAALASRRTSFLLLDDESKRSKQSGPLSSAGLLPDRKGKEVKRTRSVSSEITKKMKQVKQRNHGGWVSPSVNRHSSTGKPDKLDTERSIPDPIPTATPPESKNGTRADKGKRRAIDFASPIAEERSTEGGSDGKSPKSFWSRLRSMSVDKIPRPANQVYAQPSVRDSFVDLEPSFNAPLLLQATVRNASSRSLSKRLSLFVSKRSDPQPSLNDSSQRYRLPRTPDRDRPLKQVPDPFKRLGPDDNPLASPVTTVVDDGHDDSLERKKQDGMLDGLKRTFSTLGTSARSLSVRRSTVPRSRSKIDNLVVQPESVSASASASASATAISTSPTPSAPQSTFRGIKSKAKAEKLLGHTFDMSQMDPYYTTADPLTGPPGRHPHHNSDQAEGSQPSRESSTDPHEIFRDFDWPGPPPRSVSVSRRSSHADIPISRDEDVVEGTDDRGRRISAAQQYVLAYARRVSGDYDRSAATKESSSLAGPDEDGLEVQDISPKSTTTSASRRARQTLEAGTGASSTLRLVSKGSAYTKKQSIGHDALDHAGMDLESTRRDMPGNSDREEVRPPRLTHPDLPVRTSSLPGTKSIVRQRDSTPGPAFPAQVDEATYLRKPASNRSLRRRSNPVNIFPQPRGITSSPSLDTIGQASTKDGAGAQHEWSARSPSAGGTPPSSFPARHQAVFTSSPLSYGPGPGESMAAPFGSEVIYGRATPISQEGTAFTTAMPKPPKRAVSFAPSPERYQYPKRAQLNVLPYGPSVVSNTVRNVRRSRSSIELARPLPPPIIASESLLPAYPAPLRAITPHVKFWAPVFRREDERGVGKYHTRKGRVGRGNREGASHHWRPYALAMSEVSKPISQPHSNRLRVTVQTRAYIHLFSLNEKGEDDSVSDNPFDSNGTDDPAVSDAGMLSPTSPSTLMPSIIRRIASWSRPKNEETPSVPLTISDPRRPSNAREPTRAMFVEVAHREVERREICPWTWLKIFEADKNQIGTDDIASADESRSGGSRVRWYDDDLKKCLMEFKFEEDNEKEVWILQLPDDMQHLRWTWKSHIDEKRMDAFLRGVSISEASKKQFDSYTQLERRRERAMTYGGDPYSGGLPHFKPFHQDADTRGAHYPNYGTARPSEDEISSDYDTCSSSPDPAAIGSRQTLSVPLKGILKKTKSMSQMDRPNRASLLLKDQDPTWWDMERVIQDQVPARNEWAVGEDRPELKSSSTGESDGQRAQNRTRQASGQTVRPTSQSVADIPPPIMPELGRPTVSLDQVKQYWRTTVQLAAPPNPEPMRYYKKIVENGITITFCPSLRRNWDAELDDPIPDLTKTFSEQTTSTNLVTDASQQSQAASVTSQASAQPMWQPKWDNETRRAKGTSMSRASSTESRHRRHRSISSRHDVDVDARETPSPDSPGMTRSVPFPGTGTGPVSGQQDSPQSNPLSPHPDQRRWSTFRSEVDSPFRFAVPSSKTQDGAINSTAPLGESKRQKSSTRSRLSSLGDKLRLRKRSGEVQATFSSRPEDQGYDERSTEDGVRGRHPTARASRATSNTVPAAQHASAFSLHHMLDAVGQLGDREKDKAPARPALQQRTSAGSGSWMNMRGKLMDHLPTIPTGRPHQAQRALEAMDSVLSPELEAWVPPRDWKVVQAETRKSARHRRDSDVIPALVDVWGHPPTDE